MFDPTPSKLQLFLQKIRNSIKVGRKFHVKPKADKREEKGQRKKIREFARSGTLEFIVSIAIVLSAVVSGVDTYKLEGSWAEFFEHVESGVLYVFTLEIILKIAAEVPKWWKYFKKGWNLFDFVIVFVCWIPMGFNVSLIRMIRLLRLFKLLRMLPELRLLVSSIYGSLSSVFYIVLMMLLEFYMLGCIAVILYKDSDPFHFGDLHSAMLTFFAGATGDDWTDPLYVALEGCDKRVLFGYMGNRADDCVDIEQHNFAITTIFFTIHEVLGSLILLNMFVGAVMLSVAEAKADSAMGQVLEVTIERGRDLKIADPGFGMGLGSSDPYCIAKIGGKVHKTKKIRRSLDPKWDQDFTFWPLEKMSSRILNVSVYDWDLLGTDDYLGEVSIDIDALEFDREYRFECELDNVETGFIHFTCFKTLQNSEAVVDNKLMSHRHRVIKQKIRDARELIEIMQTTIENRKKMGDSTKNNGLVDIMTTAVHPLPIHTVDLQQYHKQYKGDKYKPNHRPISNGNTPSNGGCSSNGTSSNLNENNSNDDDDGVPLQRITLSRPTIDIPTAILGKLNTRTGSNSSPMPIPPIIAKRDSDTFGNSISRTLSGNDQIQIKPPARLLQSFKPPSPLSKLPKSHSPFPKSPLRNAIHTNVKEYETSQNGSLLRRLSNSNEKLQSLTVDSVSYRSTHSTSASRPHRLSPLSISSSTANTRSPSGGYRQIESGFSNSSLNTTDHSLQSNNNNSNNNKQQTRTVLISNTSDRPISNGTNRVFFGEDVESSSVMSPNSSLRQQHYKANPFRPISVSDVLSK